MPRARNRVCIEPGCTNTQPRTRCNTHDTTRQHTRTTSERGYGAAHQALREQWRPSVEAGVVTCARCLKPIKADAAWDLGHDDNDRTVYRGPEHTGCNRATRGRHKAPPHPRD